MTKQELLSKNGAILRKVTKQDMEEARTDYQRKANYIIETREGMEFYSIKGTIQNIKNAINSSKIRNAFHVADYNI